MNTEKAMRKQRYTVAVERTRFRYSDIGHRDECILWWVDNRGRVRTHPSDGGVFHHEIDRRVDMDKRWRGRIEPDTKTASMLAPILLASLTPELLPIPSWLARRLMTMGAVTVLVDIKGELRRVVERSKQRR
jgi:hypothetical protein